MDPLESEIGALEGYPRTTSESPGAGSIATSRRAR